MQTVKDLVLDAVCIAITVLLLSLLSNCARADQWSEADRWRQGAYTVLHVLDYKQTSKLSDYNHTERNPVLGEQPSQGEIDRYFLGTLALHYIVADQLPSKWRERFQYVTIGIQAGAVRYNYSLGIRVNF